MKITFLGSGNIRSNFSYRILKVATALHKQGHEVTIIVPSADKYNNFVSEKITSLNGVSIRQPFQFKTKHMVINLLPYVISATHMVLKDKSDLIYIYKPTPISIVGLFAKVFHQTPVVLDMDDLGSEVMKIEGHPKYQQLLVRWCESVAAKYANKLIVTSTFLFDIFRAKFPNKPIHRMSNGVDEEWFTPVQKHAEKRIVFMGAINRKNILEPLFEVVPSLIEKYPDLKICIIGDGRFLPYFKERCKIAKIEENVTFTGWLDMDQLRENLFSGDIGYNYMPYERTVLAASNMKVPQYMSRGVVPIVSDIGDLPASVNFGNAGYIAKADDTQALRQTLVNALEDKEFFQKSENSRLFSIEKYSWDILAADVEHFLGIGKKVKNLSGKKKVYVVTTSVPGNFGGAEIRNFNLIRQLLRNRDITIDLFCIANENKKETKDMLEESLRLTAHVFIKPKKSIFISIRAIVWERVQPFMTEYKLSGLGDTFRTACEDSLPDVVQVEQITAYYCILPHIKWLRARGVEIILDAHNVESNLFESSLGIFSPVKRKVGQFLLTKLRYLEIKATKKSTSVIACSIKDAAFFKKYNPSVHVVPNGVDSVEFLPSKGKKGRTIIFIGGVEYPPNADALKFYLKKIHPTVKRLVPSIKLLIVGADIQWLRNKSIDNDPSVAALGFVEDVKPYLKEASIGICPMRHGSGTRLKILTYMAAGLPVISTTKGAEGILYTPNKDILIADNPVAFAHAIFDIFTDHVHYDAMALRSRDFAVENYDWNAIGEKILRIYSEYGNN
jgi:glycosyltransferase involved in cell wall biosynthesis